ncbi:MAG: phosphoribosylformylglycinamidine synthase [Eubacteriaceae bacterium]
MIKRIFVEKKSGFDVEAKSLCDAFRKILNINGLENVKVLYRYDMETLDKEVFERIKRSILSEPNVDIVHEDELDLKKNEMAFGISYLPGQYDQHADSAMQCIHIITGSHHLVKIGKIIVLSGSLSEDELKKIKGYMINPVDSEEVSLEKLETLTEEIKEPGKITYIEKFIELNEEALEAFREKESFSMTKEDLEHVQNYFKNEEKRNPTMSELKVIDTYWSDHCRHTTFLTQIKKVEVCGEDTLSKEIKKAYEEYLTTRDEIYGVETTRPVTLMDIAVIGTKALKQRGVVTDLDESEEINACSYNITVDHDGRDEEWLLMFKNETHNHPTEIEPFGGAATCLGGAIRDPLSGRSYVYQAMRVTGSWDPRTPIEETISGKLPQRKISKEAAHGYSSYGNQIGLATGQVVEIYDPGFLAKRMEVGAVIAAVPKENVVREKPLPGDRILLVGGKTGRDGCGGATGSSKAHTDKSITESGAEVQKGNPIEERKIQRLFRNKALSLLIKRCNDFGAGGVSVAIGELADSLEIDLDRVPKKYEGLNGTELAISESQERMAVVVAPENVEKFIEFGNKENLEVTEVAKVTDSGRLIMKWKNEEILNLSRKFLETNGAPQYVDIEVPTQNFFESEIYSEELGFKENLENMLTNINIASQKGLVEMFDSTIGSGTVSMPYGGKSALSPMDGMVAKIPMMQGDTTTCSLMTYGFIPEVAKKSPYLGGILSVIDSLSKIVAIGGDFRNTKLSFQEYFERLGKDPMKWGKPFSALLGALQVQNALGTPAIGGKDSMSGTFENLSVPPTLISFAVATAKIDSIITSELKSEQSFVYLFEIPMTEEKIPNLVKIKEMYALINDLGNKRRILSAKVIGLGGIGEAISKMSFGNEIGFEFDKACRKETIFAPLFGSILVESFDELDFGILIGKTNDRKEMVFNKEKVAVKDLIEIWQEPMREVYPEKVDVSGKVATISYRGKAHCKATSKFGKPQIFIPVFPGTNCEYDSVKAFEKSGGKPVTTIFRNKNSKDINESIEQMVKQIEASQMIMIPGGFSAGDQPDGSGKFIASVFRNPKMTEAVMELLNNRDGLVLGICNGFQALIKLGLLPNGEICEITEEMPTLTFNAIGRHVSTIPMTRIASTLSPWLANTEVGEIYRIPMSHGEGRFVGSEDVLERLIANGQIATQYVNDEGEATLDGNFNPNGSVLGIEGITSPNGRVFGKMGHSERIGKGLYKNIAGRMDQQIFKSGVEYFI